LKSPVSACAVLAAVLSVCLLSGPGCRPDPAPPRPPRPEIYTQEITFRVLTSRDRPVAGAVVRLEPRQGRPLGETPLTTGPQGVAGVSWRPGLKELAQGSRDRLFDLVTSLDYRVEAPGFFPAAGRVEGRGRGRRFSQAELKSMNERPVLRPLVELVVLRRLAEAMGGELSGRTAGDPLFQRLLAFHRSLAPVLPHLGVGFDWPAFELRQGRLSLRLQWRGGSWSGLSRAPLLGRVAAGALLPVARAVGEELAPAPGVEDIRLVVAGELPPPDDPLALPGQAVISLQAPQASYRKLASGRLSPDRFLDRHRPQLELSEAPPARALMKEPDQGREAQP
jgi:hypothetical protein